jgi:hypothetical protein
MSEDWPQKDGKPLVKVSYSYQEKVPIAAYANFQPSATISKFVEEGEETAALDEISDKVDTIVERKRDEGLQDS